ncbi:MAG: nicotinate phosphoribosyltransferase [Chloroflexi bacterium]|nr:nicotinate phosphoribosyltransferase [Chloroflexota bacterium]
MKKAERQLAEGILFTDFYQLTMAQLYFRQGIHQKVAQFDHYFRSYPDYGAHQAGYCINAGLEWLLDWMQEARFHDAEIDYLRSLKSPGGGQVFAEDFLEWLRTVDFIADLEIRAIPEGRVVHPNVPITVVQGPLAVAQLLETALLNHLNFQTLIATRAARLHGVGHGQPMLEFGLRRAQDGAGNAGARAALIGGAVFTSNVGISAVLGYPPKGTHAHSLVQVFMALGEGELEAFRAYAEMYPDDCLLLVDTINTLESGVPNAIRVFEELRAKGYKPSGIRLDSGDLAYLGIQAARMLDQAGFPEVRIVLSNQLDEHVIWQIITQIQQEASRYGVDPDKLIHRLTFGVGTRLITSEGASALDGVYKLVAVCNEEKWVPAIKISETPEKTLNPGHKLAWRLYDQREKATADLLSLDSEDPRTVENLLLRHPMDNARYRLLRSKDLSGIEPLQVDVVKKGKVVYDLPGIDEIRQVRQADVDRLDAGVKRLMNPHTYHVSLTEGLWDLKQDLIRKAREG